MHGPPEDITARRLNDRFGAASAEAVIAVALDRHDGRISVVSSFGAEAAVLLHMVAAFDRSVPVLLLDTRLLFPQTLAYQTELAAWLGLTDVRRITPDETADPDRSLHLRDSAACCALRKVAPLEDALTGFAAVMTGQKRFQTGRRATLKTFEFDASGRLRVNPLADWSPARVQDYFDTFDLPRHPLVADGFPSIGCLPCTSRVAPGEDTRAGRWRGEGRQECGIHIGADGRVERKAG